MPEPEQRPLRRNRDFVLLQAGQLLSDLGTQSATIAYPLVVLALTGSAAKAGLVSFARLLPFGLLGLAAGLAADRWSRRGLMIGADAVRAAAVALLAATIALDRARLATIVVVAFVEGAGAAFFSAAQPGALRGVVPATRLTDAAGAQEVRRAIVRVTGAPLGAALFGIGRAVPFAVDAASYACSTLSLLAMRTPFGEPRPASRRRLRDDFAEGFRFLWSRPFLRTTTFLYSLGNFLMPGVLLVLVVVGRQQGLSPGDIGVLFFALGAATLVGSLASAAVRRLLAPRSILLLELWTWLGAWFFVARPNVYALLALIVPFGLAAPITDSVVVGYRIAATPDRLVGRVESVRSTIALLVAPLGPVAAGLLLAAVSARATMAVFAALGLGLAVWGTLSRSIRDVPRLDEVAAATP